MGYSFVPHSVEGFFDAVGSWSIEGDVMKSYIALVALGLMLVGCASQPKSAGDRLTVGTVQKEIHVGMSGGEVAGVLGAPNVVTTDAQGREVWIYDKISTQSAYSTPRAGVFLLIFNAGKASGGSSTTQKTLTVVVKFDKNHKVRDFAYHASQF
ncbi:MAG: hypothetical protein L0H29_01145 [Sinobacteraceae bacterium]|nr:hypothetical protein [Nevskiaceae bacterium]